MNEPDAPTLGEIGRTLHRLESHLIRVTDDHEKRLRNVERWVFAVPPTLILAAASVLAAILKG
ncbi:MAG: hypothetical protein ACOYXR_09330 [Nitrospirota bacterium]